MTDQRRLYISADLEGVAGVVSPDELARGGHDFESARLQLTQEVNAAVRGALRADPALEVIVSDGHGTYRNIIPSELDARATLLRGKPRHLAMMDGLAEGDGVMFIGYHAKAGAAGVLSHTFDDALRDVRLNGLSLGEAGLNAALATELGASVLLASGDDVLALELAAIMPQLPVIEVKTAVSSGAARSLHPARAVVAIESGAASAVRAWVGQTVPVSSPLVLDVEFAFSIHADRAELPPPVLRVDAGTVRVECASVVDAYRWVRALVVLATAG